MRKLILYAISGLFILLTIAPQKASATHAAGAEILYEWISDSTYRFFFKFYRDCTGIPPEPGTVDLCAYDACNNINFTTPMTKYMGPLPGGDTNGTPVSAGCTLYPDKCTDPTSILPGYKEWWYAAVVYLPTGCNSWKFAAWINARNASNNLSGGNLYVETTFDNTLIGPGKPGWDSSYKNSSPYFSIKPLPYMCINQQYSFNNGAIDPDGDSIVTEIIQPLDGTSCTVPAGVTNWNPPPPAISIYNTTNNPISTNNTFVLNKTTGQMTFRPTLLGASTLTTKVSEYRNGKLIGYVLRDIQVQVMACNTPPPIITPPVMSGGVTKGDSVLGCINTPLEFCVDIVHPDTETILVIGDNHIRSIPSATITYTNQRTDSVRMCFSWTPTINDTGFRTFIVTMKDSTCKPPGIVLFYTQAISIYIWPPTRGIGDTSICPKGPAYLTARGGGDFEWTMIPGGTPNSLNCYECTSPVSRATDTSYYIVTSRVNPYCVNTNKDTVRVAVLYAATFEGQDDITTCPHHAITLDLKPTPKPGATYRYKWTPSTYLSNDTIPNPVCNPTLTTTYRVEITSNISKCKSYDTILVDVLKGFRILTPDTAICEGGTVVVRATGDPRYTYTWTTPSLAGGIDNPAIINPNITPGLPDDKIRYTLTATSTLCPGTDSVASLSIEIQPIPKVSVDEDAKICFGDTMQMHGVVIPDDYPYTLTWTPGSSMDDPNKIDPIFKGQVVGDNEITLVARSSAGCSDSDKVVLTVFPADFLFVSNDTSICPGDSTQLTLTTVGIRNFNWAPNDKISNAVGLNPMAWPASTRRYYVYGIDTNLCFDTASVLITVNPAATINLPDTINLYPGQSYNMNPVTNGSIFTWFPNTGLSAASISNPVATPGVNTRYTVTTSTEAGCIASASIDILVMPDSYIEIPNAFAPGNGNMFKPLYLGVSAIKNFSIYNRWGTKIFETRDVNQGWDGRYNGELQPMGTYIYSVEGTSAAGKKFTKRGDVTMIR